MSSAPSDLIVPARGGNIPSEVPAECGTPGGMQRHEREGTPSCRDCRDAYAVYQRQYRRRKEIVAGVNDILARRPELADMAQAGVRFVVGFGESA